MRHTRTFWQLLAIHLAFAAAGGLLLATEVVAPRFALWATVLGYNLFFPAFFYRQNQTDVVALWTFLVPLSGLMIVPDWYLVDVQGTLTFPTAQGAFPVPGFMAGLWTLPLALTTATGVWAEWRWGPRIGYGAALVVGLITFGAGEWALTSVAIWRPLDVVSVGGAALYILPAELLLVAATLYAFRTVRHASAWRRLVAAPIVMLLYLGAATASYLLVESPGSLS